MPNTAAPTACSHRRAHQPLQRLAAGAGSAALLAGLLLTAAPAPAQNASRQVPTVQAGTPADTPLSERELATAALVHVGSKSCWAGQSVRIEPDAHAVGHFVLHSGAQRYLLRPVESSTGAIRLEDRSQGAVWIQLSHKSMLLGQRPNRRLLDDCANALQQANAAALLRNPGPDLLGLAQPRPVGQ